MPEKIRIDQLLLRNNLAPTIEKARALILTGDVLVNNVPIDKAGYQVKVDSEVRIRGEFSKYVGRGGDKLEGAIKHFNLNFDSRICLDIGASTGGFTDCMLQLGASKVYAVDVGHNQLDHKLREDPRVVVLEKTHIKDLTLATFDTLPTFATIDVSFISARTVLSYLLNLIAAPLEILLLVKPQFELDREQVSSGGVVKDENLQLAAVKLVSDYALEHSLTVIGFVPSQLKGNKSGNQEYFLYLKR
ncbi:MAG: TlyA family RNA methyltransferase [Proteobacteria bacterium]|nr:TlyA family RNA methyltransferase [Pseudomonadota bacterium]